MVKYICQCKDDEVTYTENPLVCKAFCEDHLGVSRITKANSDIFGMDSNYYISIICIQFIIWILMLFCCLSVLEACKYKPAWLRPTIIVIFILWILLCWYPVISLILFIILIILLIVFFNKCKKYSFQESSSMSLQQFLKA